MANPIIVTGCDAAHYDLVTDLMTSLDDVGRGGLTVGFVHVGDDAVPAAIESRVDRMVHLSPGGADPNLLHGFPLSHLSVKARLPEFFPGHDVYVWLDGDTWVQNRLGLGPGDTQRPIGRLLRPSRTRPQLFSDTGLPSRRLMGLYQIFYGADQAYRDVTLPMFNAGVVGARAASPLWASWREAMEDIREKVLGTPGLFYSDQVPLHRLVATGRLSGHPLRAVNNWLAHAATPALDITRKRVVAPTYPHEEINIVHLTAGAKDVDYPLPGGDRTISYRYGALKAFFAEGG